VLLTASHHQNIGAGPNGKRLYKSDAKIIRSRKPQKPLAGMARRAELVCARCRSPDELSASGGSEVDVNGIVPTWVHKRRLPPKRKRKRGGGREQGGGKCQNHGNDKGAHAHMLRSYCMHGRIIPPWACYILYMPGPAYISILAAAGILLIGGFLFVLSKQPIGVQGNPVIWSAGGSTFKTPADALRRMPALGTQDKDTEVQSEEIFANILIPVPASASNEKTRQSGRFEGDLGLSSLLSLLTLKPISSSGAENLVELDRVYSLIPNSAVRVNTPTHELTPEQEELRAYANAVGERMSLYNNQYRAQEGDTLWRLFQNRGDAEVMERARLIADALGELGRSLQDIEAPEGASGPHKEIVAAYFAMQERLEVTISASAGPDEPLVGTILSYNSAVEDLTGAFVAIATLISVHEVPLSSADPGNIFVFTAAP